MSLNFSFYFIEKLFLFHSDDLMKGKNVLKLLFVKVAKVFYITFAGYVNVLYFSTVCEDVSVH